MSITLSTIRAAVRVNLADSKGTSGYWTDPDLNQAINNSLKTLWSLLYKDSLRSYRDVKTTNITNLNMYYSLPDDYFMMDAVYIYGIEARPIDFDKKDQIASNSFLRPTKGQPGYYIKDGNLYVLPVPTATYSNGLKQYYLKPPPELSDSTDTVSVADKFLPIIAKLATGEAKSLKESVSEGAKITQEAIRDLGLIIKRKLVLEKDQGEENDLT